MLTIKQLITGAAITFAINVFAMPAIAAEPVTKVAEGVFAYDPQDGYYSMFVVTNEGVVAFEPVSTKHATGLLAAIASVTEQPVKYLISSHNHWDHAKGGKVFQEAGAISLVHAEAAAWMAANPHPDLAQPDETWSGSSHEIILGGTTIELHHMGMNHGLGMTVALLPMQKIAYIADIVTPKRVLFTIVPDFNIKEWLRTLDEIEQLDFDQAVFSHSKSGSPTGGKADIIATREFITDMQAAIGAEFKKGTRFDLIPKAVKMPKYADWGGYDKWLHMNVWRVMLDMWMGPFPWHPEADMSE